MILDLIPYFCLFVIAVINLHYNSKKSNDVLFFILFIFSACRYNVGFDYMSYDYLITSGGDHLIERIEHFQQILVHLSRSFFHQLFFIVNAFFAVFFTKKALERMSTNLSVSALAFLCFPLMYTNSMNIIRFWSALALVFYASTFLREKRYVVFIVLSIIALGFHRGVIVAFLFIPLYAFRMPMWANYVILLISFVGGEFVLSKILSGVMPENVFSDKLTYYASADSMSQGMSKIPYLFLIFDLICLWKYKTLIKLNNQAYRYITIFNVGVSMMFLFSFQTTLASRLPRPFLLYFLCLIPLFTTSYNVFKLQIPVQIKRIAFSSVCFILLIYLVTIYNEVLGRSQYLPYKVFFLCD